jgi:hypothetical protein
MRINGHGHILPEPSQIPNFMKEKNLFWIDSDKKFMRQGDWSRPINGTGFFIKEKIGLQTKFKVLLTHSLKKRTPNQTEWMKAEKDRNALSNGFIFLIDIKIYSP